MNRIPVDQMIMIFVCETKEKKIRQVTHSLVEVVNGRFCFIHNDDK